MASIRVSPQRESRVQVRTQIRVIIIIGTRRQNTKTAQREKDNGAESRAGPLQPIECAPLCSSQTSSRHFPKKVINLKSALRKSKTNHSNPCWIEIILLKKTHSCRSYSLTYDENILVKEPYRFTRAIFSQCTCKCISQALVFMCLHSTECVWAGARFPCSDKVTL